jgi:kelch-like protein 2/3
MLTARFSAAAVVKNNIIYVIGGNGSTLRLKTVESYNPATNSWTTEAPLLVGKSEPSVGLVGTTIVAADGYTASGDTGDNEAYNTSTNSWSALAADPTLRNGACYGSISGQLYVAGGWDNNAPPLDVTNSFSMTANKWTARAAPLHAVTVPASAVNGGLLYCVGGTDGTNVFDYVQIYQP